MEKNEAKKFSKPYETATKLSIEEFKNKFSKATIEFEKLGQKQRNKHTFIVTGDDGNQYELKTKSLRYQLFNKSLTCVTCGIEGKYFLLQRSKYSNVKRYHANLYGVNEYEEEVLMTKDHIIRSSDGGKDTISNMQTMCCICNCIIKK